MENRLSTPSLLLQAPTLADAERARQWRQASDETRLALRTPFLLTAEQQENFYRRVVCDSGGQHRYWSFYRTDRMPSGAVSSHVAFGGLTDIEWEDGLAEISLLVNPITQGQGVGRAAVRLILREAFERMRLLTVFGEVYELNPAHGFWTSFPELAGQVSIPRRKWWDGKLHGATLFWFATAQRSTDPDLAGAQGARV